MPTDEEIRRAAEILRSGGLVAFPTETVYGLGANALDPLAVDRIYLAKGRPKTSPLIVHVPSVDAARALATTWPDRAETLAQAFWPGPLTLVVPKIAAIPDNATAGLPTVGLRVPAHPVAQALLVAAGLPIAAPSANLFTHLSPTTAAHVRDHLSVDLVLDGGPSTVGIESTVVQVAADHLVLLRPGAITREQLDALAGPVFDNPHSEPSASPGQHPHHYRPRTAVFLISDASTLPPGGGIVLSHRTLTIPHHPMPHTPEAYAATLYETLHHLDSLHLPWIAIDPPPATWEAIHDRLSKML